MSRLSSILLLASLSASPVLVQGCSTPASASVIANHSATLKVDGMTCASCSVTVSTAANHLSGLASIDVQVNQGQATVTFDSAQVSAEQIAAKITDAGYQTSVLTVDDV